jgi:SH3-like domain-containing protein
MRATALSLLLLALTPTATAATTTSPHDAWVTSDHGVNVRREAAPGSEIVAILWKGARVFVRDASGAYARIDGYGVAGYAYVDAAFIGNTPPNSPERPDQHPAPAPAAAH